MRTSSKAAIAAAVVASWHSLGDGGAVVSAFVVPTGARAHLASKASTSRMMVKKQQQVPKAKVKPAPVVKKTPVYNPLAGKRSEILASKNKKKTPFASFGSGKSAFAKKLAAAPVKKKAVAAAKPFKNASAAGFLRAVPRSDIAHLSEPSRNTVNNSPSIKPPKNGFQHLVQQAHHTNLNAHSRLILY